MKALVLVDLQYDFCPGGSLAVAHGDETIPIARAQQAEHEIVVATQDWHPADHASFARMYPGRAPGEVIELNGLSQVLWPAHCVQGSPGAALHAGLDLDRITKVFPKGTDRTIDSYSGFFDNGHAKATGMRDWLKAHGVTALTVLGLATDYCVKFTVLDARQLGFEVDVIAGGCRAVNLQAGDGDRAFDEMRASGARVR